MWCALRSNRERQCSPNLHDKSNLLSSLAKESRRSFSIATRRADENKFVPISIETINRFKAAVKRFMQVEQSRFSD